MLFGPLSTTYNTEQDILMPTSMRVAESMPVFSNDPYALKSTASAESISTTNPHSKRGGGPSPSNFTISTAIPSLSQPAPPKSTGSKTPDSIENSSRNSPMLKSSTTSQSDSSRSREASFPQRSRSLRSSAMPPVPEPDYNPRRSFHPYPGLSSGGGSSGVGHFGGGGGGSSAYPQSGYPGGPFYGPPRGQFSRFDPYFGFGDFYGATRVCYNFFERMKKIFNSVV